MAIIMIKSKTKILNNGGSIKGGKTAKQRLLFLFKQFPTKMSCMSRCLTRPVVFFTPCSGELFLHFRKFKGCEINILGPVGRRT